MKSANTFEEFVRDIEGDYTTRALVLNQLKKSAGAQVAFNEMRTLLGVPPIHSFESVSEDNLS